MSENHQNVCINTHHNGTSFHNDLESKCREIDVLKDALQKKDKILEEKEKNLILAAQYGKDLLEENASLRNTVQEYNNKFENLQQDKHSLSMKLEGNEKIIKTLTAELEIQEKIQNENHKKLYNKVQEENLMLKRNVSFLENKAESLEKEGMLFKERIIDLEQSLARFEKQQLEISQLNPVQNELEEYTNQLQNQVSTLSSDKEDLEKESQNLKLALNKSTRTIQNHENTLLSLRTELDEKECQLSSKFNEVERLKSELEELRMEIDNMKLKETDPNKKGNSLFAELDDNRQLLEKQVISLNSKFLKVKTQCSIKSDENNKLKLHIASLLGVNNNATDMQYQKHLEETLEANRNQLKTYVEKCKELEEQLEEKKCSNCKCETMDEQKEKSYTKYVVEELKAKIASLEEELRKMIFKKISVDDQNLQLRRKLNQVERERDVNKSEVIQMSVKLDELTAMKNFSPDIGCSGLNEELAFHYEELPRAKMETDEKQPEKRSSRIFKEKLIPMESSDQTSENHQYFKEEEPPSKVIKIHEPANKIDGKVNKDLKKEVKFANIPEEESIENGTDASEPCPKKDSLPKVRRKMEAPHIIASSNETNECQVQ